MPLLTRRTWTTLLAAIPLVAQAPSPLPSPASPSAAAEDVRKVSQQLSEIEIPISLEPAFAFHV